VPDIDIEPTDHSNTAPAPITAITNPLAQRQQQPANHPSALVSDPAPFLRPPATPSFPMRASMARMATGAARPALLRPAALAAAPLRGPAAAHAGAARRVVAPQLMQWRTLSMSVEELAVKSGGAVMTRTITMVKKLTATGEVCRKCLDIEERLERDGLTEQIDNIIYMDMEDSRDEGLLLAQKHNVKVAPFFVVTHSNPEGADVSESAYPIYMKMKRELFGKKATVAETNADVAMSLF
jgi:hypothetical protein